MWFKWLPWQFLVRLAARSHGFLDPIAVMSYFRGFAQPSEVHEPIELLRWGVVLHARGLMNSRAIQHNLDWVWPYWVHRQFDPCDDAFVPRAFSLTHINLTHRNWTAVGVPDVDAYPLVDPAGAVMPLDDGWTIDGWVLDASGGLLAPSRRGPSAQRLELDPNLTMVTETHDDEMDLHSETKVVMEENRPVCQLTLTGQAARGGWLVVALRPCNPEGVSFVHRIARDPRDGRGWLIEDRRGVEFSEPIERHMTSDYREGDVAMQLAAGEERDGIECSVGMATAAAMFRLTPGAERAVTVRIPLHEEHAAGRTPAATAESAWRQALDGTCRLHVPDEKIQFLYDAAVRTLALHSPGDVYPGPYTYRRFWFRDAAFIINALLDAGMLGRAERALARFLPRQTRFGFFHSQEGEWDSNGEALWILNRFLELTGRTATPEWAEAARRGAHWIARKRLSMSHGELYGGLLPAGFSAEHLGPNDYYYWDDFWSVGGLRAAARMLRGAGRENEAAECDREALSLMGCIERSLAAAERRLGRPAMPAAPARRLDAGCIGSLAAAWPLALWKPDDRRVLDTTSWLLDNCMQQGGFFQDMIHSGINAYLTLHIAQALLRAGDRRAWDLVRAVADLATPAGQWPEAIHPRTGGGCMGDGQHVWAAAEWVAMLRNCFVMEEEDRLVLGAGVPQVWLHGREELKIGPAPTRWGAVTVTIAPGPEPRVQWTGQWHGDAPTVEVRMAGRPPVAVDGNAGIARP